MLVTYDTLTSLQNLILTFADGDFFLPEVCTEEKKGIGF